MPKKLKTAIVGGLAAIVLGASALTYHRNQINQIKKFSLPSEEEARQYEPRTTDFIMNYLMEYWGEYKIYGGPGCLRHSSSRPDEKDFVNFYAEVKHLEYGPLEGVKAIIVGYKYRRIGKQLDTIIVPIKKPDGKKVNYIITETDENGKYNAKFIPEKDAFYIAWYNAPVKRPKSPKMILKDYYPSKLSDNIISDESSPGLCISDECLWNGPLENNFLVKNSPKTGSMLKKWMQMIKSPLEMIKS